jgi:hypothetical protein
VVTADSGLSWEVRKLGADVVAPEAWEGLKPMRGRKKKTGPRKDAAPDKPRTSSRDVDYWLGVFGEEGPEED